MKKQLEFSSSSMVKNMWYDSHLEQLYVEFYSGNPNIIYCYNEFTQTEVDQLLLAKSIGVKLTLLITKKAYTKIETK